MVIRCNTAVNAPKGGEQRGDDVTKNPSLITVVLVVVRRSGGIVTVGGGEEVLSMRPGLVRQTAEPELERLCVPSGQ